MLILVLLVLLLHHLILAHKCRVVKVGRHHAAVGQPALWEIVWLASVGRGEGCVLRHHLAEFVADVVHCRAVIRVIDTENTIACWSALAHMHAANTVAVYQGALKFDVRELGW